MTPVIVLEKRLQAALKLSRTAETASDQKPTVSHPKGQFRLIEPRAVFGSEMKHMAVARVTQKGA